MIQVKDTRVNILFAVIALGMFVHFIQNFLAMSNNPMYFIGSVVVPLVFLIMMALFVRESMYFLLIPLIAYFSERLFILLNQSNFLLLRYNSIFYSPAETFYIYLNLFRNLFAIVVALMLILALTSKSMKTWQKAHQFVIILIVLQVLQLLTFNQFRSDFFAVLLQVPLFLYFALIAYYVTHPKYFAIYFDPHLAQFSHSSMMSHASYSSQAGQMSQAGMTSQGSSSGYRPIKEAHVPTSRICPQCAANNKLDAHVCHQCGNGLDQSAAPIFQKSSSPKSHQASKPNISATITCPECQHVNQGTNYCLNCGHSLSGKGRVS